MSTALSLNTGVTSESRKSPSVSSSPASDDTLVMRISTWELFCSRYEGTHALSASAANATNPKRFIYVTSAPLPCLPLIP